MEQRQTVSTWAREKLELTGQARKAADSQWTKMTIAGKANLRKEIASSSQLVGDFEFFLEKMEWHPELLLQILYWDCNMKGATPQTVIAREKRETWPIAQKFLDALCGDMSTLAARLEQLNETEFSLARGLALRGETGDRLPQARERHLLKAFRELPETLHLYSRDLRQTILDTAAHWSRQKQNWESLIGSARQDSLYERIRAKTGQYHQIRLHRLVNAARRIQGLPQLESRAFVVWLNRLKKRCERAKLQAAYKPEQVLLN
jgi:hypothetical protein